MRALCRGQPCHVLPKKPDRPGGRAQVAGDLIEQRGLAGAVRTDDEPALSGIDAHRYILSRRQAAEELCEVDDFQSRNLRHLPPPRGRVSRRFSPGTIPSGITSTMSTNTKPSSMFQRSI